MRKISLLGLLLFGLNISAEGDQNDTKVGIEVQEGMIWVREDQNEVKVGIEIRDGKIWIRAESSKGIRVVTEPSIEVLHLRERKRKVLEQSWARYPEDTACKWLHDCREICKDIYRSRWDKLFCGEFPENQVKKLDEIVSFKAQILEDKEMNPLPDFLYKEVLVVAWPNG